MKDDSYQTLLDEYKAEEERKAKIDKMIAVLNAVKNKGKIAWRKIGELEWHEKQTKGTERPNFRDCEYKVVDE